MLRWHIDRSTCWDNFSTLSIAIFSTVMTHNAMLQPWQIDDIIWQLDKNKIVLLNEVRYFSKSCI